MTETRPAAVIVLAAGEGTRMKSSIPKVLHPLCGRTMLGHVLAAARDADPAQLIVVAGHGREQVMSHLAEHEPDVRVVVQERQGGTGHAVSTAMEAAGLDRGTVMVTYGDSPLLRGRTLAALAATHADLSPAATVLTAVLAEPVGYGRIIRDADGTFTAIVEEADATPEQRAITEVNPGIYAFDAALLADSVKRVATGNSKGEEYLTDVVAILRADGHQVASVRIPDATEVLGVNDQAQLAQVRQILNARLARAWMQAGATVVDPGTTSIDVGVVLAPDVEIGPGTQLEGSTVVEAGARVGPACHLRNTTVGAGASVTHAVCEDAWIGAGTVVGPFAYLPPGTTIGPGTPVQQGTPAQPPTIPPTSKGAQQA